MAEQTDSKDVATPFQNRGLFSDHFLKARLPEGNEWQLGAKLADFRGKLESLYESKKPILLNLNEAQTEKEFIQPLLDLLGYGDSYAVQVPTKQGQQTNRPDYALFPDENTKNQAYAKLNDNDYTHCIGIADAKYWERELDLAKSTKRDTFSNQNPSFQIAGYLTGTKQRWGILTNGRHWRLYSSSSHQPLGNYFQIDLVELLSAPDENLKYFYLFFRREALLQVEGKSFLDRVFDGSEEYAVELEVDIKARAYDVVQDLCRGFAADFKAEELTESVLMDIYDNSLTLLYRLLFVFYAEARELLPLTTSTSYRNNYSMRKVTDDIDELVKNSEQLSSHSKKTYQYIGSQFDLINSGDDTIGIPEYNGGLFNPQEHPFLQQHGITDAYLVPAIHHLARVTDRKLKREVAVDYNTLSERHLGSIYEGLLEFKLQRTKGELYLANDKGERKASGSYYTPQYIVDYIVENTLDPLVKEAQEKVKTLRHGVDKEVVHLEKLRDQKQSLELIEKYNRDIAKERARLLQPYLSLKILDPAMGSGHFLSRATNFLAEAIATDPCIERNLELTEESELTYYRRRIVETCIYGVDLNPLAVELAKLTLWLTTMAKSKPLSFLNHHLRVGNSLIGVRVSDLDEILKAKRKNIKSLDLSRAPVQIGQFEWEFNNHLKILLQSRALIAQIPTETLENIHEKEKWENDFESNVERFRTLADLWISTHFGNVVSWNQYNTLRENLQSSTAEWDECIQKKHVQKALAIRQRMHFFHWELEFPEVFYDEIGNRKDQPGFDVIIGNPPYDVLEKERLGSDNPHALLAEYLESSPLYHPALGGKVNLFRPFLIRDLELSRHSGLVGKIVPLAIVNDFSCSRTRGHLLHNSTIIQLECFPQKDDPRNRVFEDAKLSTCVLIFSKPGPTVTFSVKIYPGKYFVENHKKVSVLYKEIEAIDKDVLPIPLVNQEEWDVATRIHSQLPAWRMSEIAELTRGEINQTIFSEYITKNPSHTEMIKGVEIDRYAEHWHLSQGEKQWFDEKSYSAQVKNAKNIPNFRIGVQRITGIDERTRLRATLFERRVYFADSTNSVASEDIARLRFLLALTNSCLFNWRFKLTSTNNNVSTNELDRVPVRRINFTTPEGERKDLLDQVRVLYVDYLRSRNFVQLGALLDACLPQNADGSPDMDHEKSDVVHDLLAFLAAEMTRLNKEEQAAIRAFLIWLEKEILKGSVEDQKNKTKIRNFHEGTFEDLLDILKKNNVVPDPCPSQTRATILAEFTASTNILTPLSASITTTDKLIDKIVYRLYGLSGEEITIVEGCPIRE